MTVVPTGTAPAPIESRVTVITPAAQNPPPSFIELKSGKFLLFYCPGSSHTSTDGFLAMKTAANEAAVLAENFSAQTIIEAFEPGLRYYSAAYASQVEEGPESGRVYIIYGSGRDIPGRTSNEWQTWVRYTDNPDDDVITWSERVEIPNLFDGGYGIDANIKGQAANHAMIEKPGTNGQEWVVALLGFDSTEKYEYSKLIATTTTPMGTWSVRSVIQPGGGPSATYSPSEPVANIIYLANGTAKLAVGVDLWPTQVYFKTSSDWGVTWDQGSGVGTTIATNAIAPPAFVQCPDLSIIAMYRNLADSEHMWMARSTDFGATWPQKWLFDSGGRMRYGNMQVLQSLHVGVCYGMETPDFPSAQGGIYFNSLSVTPPTGGSAPSITGSALAAGPNFSASLVEGGMPTLHRVEYGATSGYGSVTDWRAVPPRPALPWFISQALPAGSPLHARLVAKNLVGSTNGADAVLAGLTLTPATETDAAQPLTYGLRISGLTLDPDAFWHQSGTALTVHAAAGRRREVTGIVTSSTGGPCSFSGPDAADFEVSLNGTDWASSVTVPAGDTPIWLSAEPSATGAISAELGVPA